MHEGKTGCMLFGTGPRLARSTSFSVAIDGKALLSINILGLFSMRRLRGMRTFNT